MRIHLMDVDRSDRWALAWGTQGLIDLGVGWWLGGWSGVILLLVGGGCLGLATAHLREYLRRRRRARR